MKEAIPLLPPSCRELIRMIEAIDFGDFPKRYFLIFDTMFCAYLRRIGNGRLLRRLLQETA